MKKFVIKMAFLAAIPAVVLSMGAMRASAAPMPGSAATGMAFGQERPWDAPPSEFDEVNRRAFHDGIDAAQSDFLSGRNMNPGGSPLFKHPPVPRELRDAYRASFTRGYEAARQRSMYMHDHPGTGWDHDHEHWHQ